jgi:hypothetical protein
MSSASLELRSRSTVLELRGGHRSVKVSSLEVWQPSLVSTSLVAEREEFPMERTVKYSDWAKVLIPIIVAVVVGAVIVFLTSR